MSAKQPTAGYSGKPLADKLGIRDGMRVAAVGAPRGYGSWLAPLPKGATIGTRLSTAADLVHYFVERRSDLKSQIAGLNRALRDDAVLWISWPKKSSGRRTDLTEDALREMIRGRRSSSSVDWSIVARARPAQPT